MLKEYRGHTAFVTSASITPDQQHIISTSVDGSIRIWNIHTTECSRIIPLSPTTALLGAVLLPGDEGMVAVERSERMVVVSMEGKMGMEMMGGDEEGKGGKKVEWVGGVVSAAGLWVWGLSVEGTLIAFDVRDGSVVQRVKVHKAEGIALAAHPHINVVATAGQDSTVRLWR